MGHWIKSVKIFTDFPVNLTDCSISFLLNSVTYFSLICFSNPLLTILKESFKAELIVTRSNLRSSLRLNLRSSLMCNQCMNPELRIFFITHFCCQKKCSMSKVFYLQRASWDCQNSAVAILSSILSLNLSSILTSILWILVSRDYKFYFLIFFIQILKWIINVLLI